MVSGQTFDTRSVIDLSADESVRYKDLTTRTLHKGDGVTTVRVDSDDLSLDTVIETKNHGSLTVQQYLDCNLRKERCQSPFRSSDSWAAFISKDSRGVPFLHDVGSQTNYRLPDAVANELHLKIAFGDVPQEPDDLTPHIGTTPACVTQPSQSRPAFALKSSVELTAKPKLIDWQIRGFFECNNLGLIFGEPESGKSLLALDMAFCIASGLEWCGNAVKKAKVAYIAGEGFSGYARRIKALELKYKTKAPDLFVSEMPAALIDANSAVEVMTAIEQTCKGAELIVIDTLHRNLGSGDENSATDMGAFFNNIDYFLRSTGSTVLIVHHTGHGDKGRSRGSSSINGALDVEYKVSKDSGVVTFINTKVKDFGAPEKMNFEIMEKPLGWIDDVGEPLTSVVLEPTEKSPVIRKKISVRAQAVLDVLIDAIVDQSVDATPEVLKRMGSGKPRKVVHIDRWRKKAYAVIDVDSEDEKRTDALRKAFTRTRNKLRDLGKVDMLDDHWWVV